MIIAPQHRHKDPKVPGSIHEWSVNFSLADIYWQIKSHISYIASISRRWKINIIFTPSRIVSINAKFNDI